MNSERCIITPLSATDIEAASAIFTNVETRRYLGGALHKEDALYRLLMWLNDDNSEYYCVYLKDCHDLIGMVYLTPYHDQTRFELSYEFLPQYWGKGFAYEVMSHMLTYCFIERAIQEVVAETQTKNITSRRLLEKLGYQLEKEMVRFGEKQSVYVKRKP